MSYSYSNGHQISQTNEQRIVSNLGRLYLEQNYLEIFHLSNFQTNFTIIQYSNNFYLSVYLEYGFQQIEKTIEINKNLFNFILNNTNQFDIYSIKTIENTTRLKIEDFFVSTSTVYLLDGFYFLEKWKKLDNALTVQTMAQPIDLLQYQQLKSFV